MSGTVLNAKTREPLAKAQVELVSLDGGGAAPDATATDGSGRFKLTGVPPGQYRAMASRNGFARPASKPGQPPPPLTLAPGQTVDGLALELVPPGVIVGHVVDEDGQPLANARIQPFRYINVHGERQLMPLEGASSTDDRGAYRMFGLNAGRYYISAAYSGSNGSRGGPGRGGPMASMTGPAPPAATQSYPAVFYPGVADPGQAIPIQLGAGEERQGVDFRLAPARNIRIRGHVSPPPTRPREVLVTLTPRGAWGAASFGSGPLPPAFADAKGEFELQDVAPGAYSLAALVNRDGSQVWTSLPVQAGSGDIDGIELAFRPKVDVKGRVQFDGDSPPGLDLTKLAVNLTPLYASMGVAGSSRSALDAAGSFQLRNAAQGDYRLSIGPLDGDTYLKTVKYGGADVTARPVSVGEAPGIFEVALSAGGARVEGVVTDDGKPAVDVLVTAIPDAGPADLHRAGRTDRNGRFSLRGLAPGGYTLYACRGNPEGLSPDPEDLEGFQDKARKITVEEKGRATADLTLIHIQDE